MQIAKTIREEREDLGNNDSRVKKGVYLTTDGDYWWLTSVRSGICKRKTTAMKNAGFERRN